MGQQVTTGAVLMCDKGLSPCSLIATTALMQVSAGAIGITAANIMDNKITNIPTFGMCTSMANPQVASATSAAQGVLTPMPCVPAIAAPWTPGCPTVTILNQPALNNSSKCVCSYAGQISISSAGQFTVDIP